MKKNKYKFLSQIAVVLSLFVDSYSCTVHSKDSKITNPDGGDVISLDLNRDNLQNDFSLDPDIDLDELEKELDNAITLRTSRNLSKKKTSKNAELNNDIHSTNTKTYDEVCEKLYKEMLPFLYIELDLRKTEDMLNCGKFGGDKDFFQDSVRVIEILKEIKDPAERFSVLISTYNKIALAASFLKVYFEYDKNLPNKISFNMKKYLGEDFIENIEKTGIAQKISKGNLSYSNILNRMAYSTLIFTYVINYNQLFPELKFIDRECVKNFYTFKKIQDLIISKDSVPTILKTLLLKTKASWKLLWLLGYVIDSGHITDEDFIKCFDYYGPLIPRLSGIFRLFTMLSILPQDTCEVIYRDITNIANNPSLLDEYKRYYALYDTEDQKLSVLCNMIMRFQENFPQYRNYPIDDIVDSEHNLQEALTNLIFLFVNSLPSSYKLESHEQGSKDSKKTPVSSPTRTSEAYKEGKKDGEKTPKRLPETLMFQILSSPAKADKVMNKTGKVAIGDLFIRKIMDDIEDETTIKGKPDKFYALMCKLTCGELCEFIISYLNKEYGTSPVGQAFLSYKKNNFFRINLSTSDHNVKSVNFEKVGSFKPKKLNSASNEVFSVFDLIFNTRLSNEDKENLLLILVALMSDPSQEEKKVLAPFLKYNLSQLKVSLFPSLSIDFSDESMKIIELGKKKLYPSEKDLDLAKRYNKERNLTYNTIDRESRNNLLINLNILTKHDRSFAEKDPAAQAVYTILSDNIFKLFNQPNKKNFTSFDIHMMLVDAAHINSIPFAIEACLVLHFNLLSPEQKDLLNSLSALSLSSEGDFGSSRMEHKRTVFKILKKEFDILERNNPQYASFDVFNLLSDLINIESPTFAIEAWLVMEEFRNTPNKLPGSTRPELIQNTSKPLITNDPHNK